MNKAALNYTQNSLNTKSSRSIRLDSAHGAQYYSYRWQGLPGECRVAPCGGNMITKERSYYRY